MTRKRKRQGTQILVVSVCHGHTVHIVAKINFLFKNLILSTNFSCLFTFSVQTSAVYLHFQLFVYMFLYELLAHFL